MRPPSAEVRFKDLYVATEVYADLSRNLPSVIGFYRECIEVSYLLSFNNCNRSEANLTCLPWFSDVIFWGHAQNWNECWRVTIIYNDRIRKQFLVGLAMHNPCFNLDWLMELCLLRRDLECNTVITILVIRPSPEFESQKYMCIFSFFWVYAFSNQHLVKMLHCFHTEGQVFALCSHFFDKVLFFFLLSTFCILKGEILCSIYFRRHTYYDQTEGSLSFWTMSVECWNLVGRHFY